MNHKRAALGCGLVAASYFYFLLFAQFAFLKLVRAQFPGETDLRLVMGMMGGSGILLSLITAWRLPRVSAQSALRLGLLLCGTVGASAPFATGMAALCFTAIGIGAGLAILTVSLATSLNSYAEFRSLALVAGIGTGSAYFLCNVPGIFNAGAATQSYLSAAACFIMAGCTYVRSPVPASSAAVPEQLHRRAFVGAVLALLALVWLDSAAFLIIQQTEQLKSSSWGGDIKLWLNAGIHLGAALMAGILTDRGYFRGVLLAAFAALALGALALTPESGCEEFAGLLYCAGVSLYSTVLVALPAKGGGNNLGWRAGTLYAVAGWFGSAMGIGMAQDLHYIPAAFLIVSALILLVSLFGREIAKHRMSLMVALPFIPAAVMQPDAKSSSELSSVVRGRAVYISEGCIHCHSQSVREGFVDEELWGPYVPIEKILAEQPPLIGNRRLGPDLLNVGNRRSRDWLKIQLISPASLEPETLMPRYDWLFRDGRGEDLIAYLQSLGAKSINERNTRNSLWKVPEGTEGLGEKAAKQLFQEGCASCHGQSADGNGALRGLLDTAPRNLLQDRLQYVHEGTETETDDLARVIKFGISGSAMAGHEYYEPDELLGLVRLIQIWRKELNENLPPSL